MCGIAGFYGSKFPSLTSLSKSSNLIKHRGPDSGGSVILRKKKLALIHRRLSIIDLDKRSNQPMKYEDSILIFNGEIYNYIELRNN